MHTTCTAPYGGGYEPTPTTPSGGYNPSPSGGGGYNPTPSGGWFSPPNMPSYLTPPGTLYPQDPGFRPNDAPGSRGRLSWRAAALAAMAGVLLLAS